MSGIAKPSVRMVLPPLRPVTTRSYVPDYPRFRLDGKVALVTPRVASAAPSRSRWPTPASRRASRLHAECRILLIDEPTRGVDVGAKREIYQLLASLATRGLAILMVSSELPEVLGVADRILVMREGRITADLGRAEATVELVLHHATRHTA